MEHGNTILTITGSDSTGGSGVQADIKTISELGGYAVSVVTSITLQNTLGIQEFYDLPARIVQGQMEAIVNDVQPEIVKIGMVRRVDVLRVIVDTLSKHRPRHIIYDPILYSSKGERLMDDEVVTQIRRQLVPLCSLVIEKRHNMHGAGNAYASAIAVFLSQGESLATAQERAEAYMESLQSRLSGLRGRGQELYSEFLSLLKKHIHTNNDVAYYADRLNVSPRYLAQVCKRKGKSSPKQIIDSLLIQELKQALLTPGQPVKQVAYDYGFSSQAHFTKFFRKMEDITPSQYRKQE